MLFNVFYLIISLGILLTAFIYIQWQKEDPLIWKILISILLGAMGIMVLSLIFHRGDSLTPEQPPISESLIKYLDKVGWENLPSIKEAITTTSLNLRSSPDDQSQRLNTFSQGTVVILRNNRQGNWFEVSVGKYNGWMHGQYLRPHKIVK